MRDRHPLNINAINLSEKEIVLLLKKRDIQGMNALYDQYGNYIYGFICQIIHYDDIAETVLQDTFLKVWNMIDSFSVEKGRFVTWLISIARNTAIDMTRSKHFKQSMKLISLDNVPTNTKITDMDVRMENLDIYDIVSGLDKKYYEVIQLIYFKGFTHVEVAKELDIPLGTVKGRVRKAFKDLRIIFER